MKKNLMRIMTRVALSTITTIAYCGMATRKEGKGGLLVEACHMPDGDLTTASQVSALCLYSWRMEGGWINLGK